VELIVISRILRNFGYSCITLCHVDSRKYFSPYLSDGCTVQYRGLTKTKACRALYWNMQ